MTMKMDIIQVIRSIDGDGNCNLQSPFFLSVRVYTRVRRARTYSVSRATELIQKSILQRVNE